jgi:hypothetical protein
LASPQGGEKRGSDIMNSLTVANVVAFAALSLTVLGLAFTAWQIRYNTRVQRGMLFKEVYEKFLNSEEFHYVYGLIEQKEPIFSKGYGASSPDEARRRQAAVEHLFAHFEVICSLQRRGLFRKEDMLDLNYAIERVAHHPGFFAYEAFLADWAGRMKVSRGPFDNVFRYTRTTLRITPS